MTDYFFKEPQLLDISEQTAVSCVEMILNQIVTCPIYSSIIALTIIALTSKFRIYVTWSYIYFFAKITVTFYDQKHNNHLHPSVDICNTIGVVTDICPCELGCYNFTGSQPRATIA